MNLEEIQNSVKNVFSKDGEDGVLEYLFSQIGTHNKFGIEFGAYNGSLDSNTCNLRLNHGWNCLLLDRKKRYSFNKQNQSRIIRSLEKTHSPSFIKLISCFLAKKGSIKECLIPKADGFRLVKNWSKRINYKAKDKHSDKSIVKVLRDFYVFDAWITADNIMQIFDKHKVPQMFDLLSIDIDGNDYWIWKAISEKRFRPRVVIIEFNSSIGPEESKVIPYREDFKYNYDNYFGASLLAMKKLGNSKGYSLIYQNAPFNAFFVLSELLSDNMSDIPIETLFPIAKPHPKLKKCPKGKKWINV